MRESRLMRHIRHPHTREAKKLLKALLPRWKYLLMSKQPDQRRRRPKKPGGAKYKPLITAHLRK